MDKFDIIIIGSGLGGLVCAYILSKEGYNVCVLEKEKVIGGCLQTFKRDNCIFDTGVHFIGSLDENQTMYKFFKYLGIINKLKLKKLDENCFNIINFNGKEYSQAQGYERYHENLLSYFPKESKSITNYLYQLKNVTKSLNIYNLQVTDNTLLDIDYISINAYKYLKGLSSDNNFFNAISGHNSLYAGIADKTSLYIHNLITNSFIESSYRIIDGSSSIADLIAERIINNGGTILKESEVVKLMFDEEDKLKSVKTKDGRVLEANTIISDINPASTLDMLDTNKLRKSYLKRIKGIQNTTSAFCVYISLKVNTFKYLNYNYYYFNENIEDTWTMSAYNIQNWPECYLLLTPATSKSDIYADSIILMTYMKYDEVRQWENTYIEQRGEEYKMFKESKADKLINLAMKRFPELRSCIKNYYTSTPLTYRDYTGTLEGSLYGLQKDCNYPLETYIPARTKIPNLLLTGQNTGIHGALGVCISALLTCGELCGLNNLIRKIGNE